MTDREKAIVMAYTGTAMLIGEKFSIFHKYIEDILGRPVWTHELADDSVCEEIKEKSKSDFLELCKNEETREWNPVYESLPNYTGLYLVSIDELVTTLSFDGTGFRNHGSIRVEVDAWMSLPKPYKSEVKDEDS